MTSYPKPTHKRRKSRKNNSFPDHVKRSIWESQKGLCAYSGIYVDNYKSLEYHHISLKGSGQTSTEWEHDYRNGVGLLPNYHIPMLHSGINQTYWKLVWEVWAILKHGWWRGQEMNFHEWADLNEYRLKKTKLDPSEIFATATGKALSF